MTDAELVKALRCDGTTLDCSGCPYRGITDYGIPNCTISRQLNDAADRIEQLIAEIKRQMQAKEDGRLIILPHKADDIIYLVDRYENIPPKIRAIKYGDLIVRIRKLPYGDAAEVYTTEKEAKAALRGVKTE